MGCCESNTITDLGDVTVPAAQKVPPVEGDQSQPVFSGANKNGETLRPPDKDTVIDVKGNPASPTEWKRADSDSPLPFEAEAMRREVWEAMRREVFQDHKWENALRFLEAQEGWGTEMAEAVICNGAKSFGIWHLPSHSLAGLVRQLTREASEPSPAIRMMRDAGQRKTNGDAGLRSTTVEGVRDPVSTRAFAGSSAKSQAELSGRHMLGMKRMRLFKFRLHAMPTVGSVEDWRASLYDADDAQKIKWGMQFLVLIVSFAYALKVVSVMYPKAWDVFGWPVFFARMGGMACVLWTTILYLTMARGMLSTMYGCHKGKLAVAPLDAHKDLHIMCGRALIFTSVEHVVMHLLGTVPGVLTHTADELNDFLGCANTETTPDFMNVNFAGIQWPACPLTESPKTVWEVLFKTMPGLTGVLLMAVLALIGYTASVQRRKKAYDAFYYIHNIMIFTWPVLLFFHGSNAWIGLGMPLVVLSAALPFLLYCVDRGLRLFRYYAFAGGAVRIVTATVRPGKKNGPDGALTYIKVSSPPYLWRFRPGMYAFICMPEYAPLQWHPFTICSGLDDDTVDFLIAGVGDWTQEMARRCMAARDGKGSLPKVALDGPFMAPTQSALQKKVLIAVGAGVGITPFLSLMSTIISSLGRHGPEGERKLKELKEVHFFWMTRSVDEFLFGRTLFTQILRRAHLKNKVFIHLHTTAKPDDKDPTAYVFREAVRRQSRIDREAFKQELACLLEGRAQDLMGPLLPWCWADGAKEDVLWVTHLLLATGDEEKTRISNAHTNHWGEAMLSPSIKSCQDMKAVCSLMDVVARPSAGEREDWLVPIVFGRPDFLQEVRSIGKAWPGCNVHLYACANDQVVETLQNVASACTRHAEDEAKAGRGVPQTYSLHFERFG